MEKFEDYQCELKRSSSSSNPPSKEHSYIPCHYQNYGDGTKDLILYFHGNAEDIGNSSTFTRRLAMELKTQILAVEYPGYGVYEGTTNAKIINEDAEIVFDFLTHEVGMDPKNIIIFGRSIGSGPATHLAANRNPGALVLMSAYMSIRSVIRDIVGQFLSGLFAERFSNIEEIEKAECPCFFIHGKKDKVIPWEHSKSLFERCKSPAKLNLSETMSHNTFKMASDITNPLRQFLEQHGFNQYKGPLKFPDYVMRVPLKKYKPRNRDFASKIIENIVSD